MIAKYTKNLYSSEVYRELERQAVHKGHFKPSEAQVVKTAAAQLQQQEAINKSVDTTPSEDLTQDVARLAFAMRRKGYVCQAEELEEKLVLFKKAESDLYNVTSEKNKDFIQFSHRDGEKEIIEGAGELGVIETIDTLAEKIRAVTQKEPTGKLPGKSANLSELAELIKEAQMEGSGEPATETTESGQIDAATKSSVNRVIELLNSLSQSFQQMQNVNFDDAMTTYLHGQAGKSSVFGTIGGNYQVLDRYGAAAKAAYGSGEQSINTIYNAIISNPQNANAYLQSIGVNEKFANKVQNVLVKNAIDLKSKTTDATPRTTGTGGIAGRGQPTQSNSELTDQQKQLAHDIAYRVDTQIKQQQVKAQAEVDKVVKSLDEKKKKAAWAAKGLVQFARYKVATLDDARNFYIRIQRSLGQIGGVLSEIDFVLNGFGMQDASGNIKQGIELLKGALGDLKSRIGSMSVANIPDTHGRLSSIRAKLNKLLQKDDNNRKAKNTLSLVNKMMGAIKQNQAKGEKAVLNAIQGGYDNWREFDMDTIGLEKLVNEEIGGE